MNKSSRVLITNANKDTNNGRDCWDVHCYDGHTRRIYVDLIDPYDYPNFVAELHDAWFAGKVVEFYALDGYSANQWFVKFKVIPFQHRRISVMNHAKHRMSKFQNDLFRKAVKYAMEVYKIDKHSTDDFRCTIVILDENHSGGNSWGSCRYHQSADEPNFTIEILLEDDNNKHLKMLETIFHEFRHIQQHVTKRLQYKDDDYCNGTDRWGPHWRNVPCFNMDYHDRPWEKDAFRTSERMITRFLSTL